MGDLQEDAELDVFEELLEDQRWSGSIREDIIKGVELKETWADKILDGSSGERRRLQDSAGTQRGHTSSEKEGKVSSQRGPVSCKSIRQKLGR